MNTSQWWADQVPMDRGEIASPVIPLVLPRETDGQPPLDHANAAVFCAKPVFMNHEEFASSFVSVPIAVTQPATCSSA